MPLEDDIQQLNKNLLYETLINYQLIIFLPMHVRSTFHVGLQLKTIKK